MTIIIPIYAALAGFLAGCTFSMLANEVIVGVTAPFIPLFMLAGAGMVYGRAGIHVAAVAALPPLFLFSPLHEALLLTATHIIPCVLMIRTLMMALLVGSTPPMMIWSSLGAAILAASLYGALFYAAMIGSDNAMYQQLVMKMQEEFNSVSASLEPDMSQMGKTILSTYPHVIFAFEYWVLILGMTLVTVFAQMVAVTFGMQRRPELVLKPFAPPLLLPAIIAVAIVGACLPYARIAAASHTIIIIAMLPYFFSGLAVIHAKLRSFQHPALLFACFYSAMIVFFGWAPLAITLYGLSRHLGSLNRSHFNR
jgi:hypothetical protein